MEVRVLFEEQPLVLILLVVMLVEIWLRVREPLFALVVRMVQRTRT